MNIFVSFVLLLKAKQMGDYLIVGVHSDGKLMFCFCFDLYW